MARQIVRLPDDPDALRIHIQADGSISRPSAERMALFMADDIGESDAWKLVGKKNQGGSIAYRQKLVAATVFQSRLAQLKAEKELLMSDAVFGETKWMVQQMWREARATGQATMMQKAVELRMKILEREAAFIDRDSAPTPGRPGKPSVENPQTSAALEDIRSRLKAVGVPAPAGDQPAVSSDPVEKIDTPSAGHTFALQVGQDVVAFETPAADLATMLDRVG